MDRIKHLFFFAIVVIASLIAVVGCKKYDNEIGTDPCKHIKVEGIVKDPEGKPVSGILVKYADDADFIRDYCISSNEGRIYIIFDIPKFSAPLDAFPLSFTDVIKDREGGVYQDVTMEFPCTYEYTEQPFSSAYYSLDSDTFVVNKSEE